MIPLREPFKISTPQLKSHVAFPFTQVNLKATSHALRMIAGKTLKDFVTPENERLAFGGENIGKIMVTDRITEKKRST